MRSTVPILAIASVVAGCTTPPVISDKDRTVPFACNAVVLIGRLKNEDYQSVNAEDDIIGHGWVSATLRVRQVVKGAEIPSVVPVRYLAHTYMREDRDFMFVAAPTDKKFYVIQTAKLVSFHPRLAAHCG